MTTRLPLATAAIVCLVAGASNADLIVLNDRAAITGPVVQLKHIAQLHGDEATRLGDLEITRVTGANQTVQMIDVRRVLDEAGVHWGKTTLRGATRIVVIGRDTGSDEPRKPRNNDGDTRTVIAANLVDAVDLGVTTPPVQVNPDDAETTGAADEVNDAPSAPARTLRRILVEMILRRVAAHPSDVRLTFDKDSDAALELTDADYRFEIEPLGSRPVGRVPIIVRRYRAGQLAGTERVRVDVSVRRAVVITRRTLGRHQTITADDIAVEVRWLNSIHGDLVETAESVVGQRTAGLIRQDRVLEADDVTAPVLVKRGQITTVSCVSGSLVLKTVARALDDASMGDTIRFRNERTREEFLAKVNGPQQAIMQLDAARDADRATASRTQGGAR